MMPTPAPDFHRAEVFRRLPHAERLSLLEEGQTKHLPPGGYLVRQEDLWPYVVYVVAGQLRWTMLSTVGREHVLFELRPGQTFWAHSLFDGLPMPASLVATKKTEGVLWDKETILRYLQDHPEAMWEITTILMQAMRQAREIIYNLAFKPVAGRLAALLLQQAGASPAPSIERDFTLNDLASMVAATPEVVCRVLYQFQKEGVLEITRASITIQDFEALKLTRGE